MICILIIIACLVFGIVLALESVYGVAEILVMGFMGAILGALISILLVGFTMGMVSCFASTTYVKSEETKIIALQDNSSVQGRFFLGSGNIDGTMKYVYMKEEDGGYKMDSLDVENVTIIYSDSTKIEVYNAEFKNKAIRFLFCKYDLFSDSKYKIYVPKGTIKQNFNVDLQ